MFKKNSLFSTGWQRRAGVKGHRGERVLGQPLLLNAADGLDLRGLAVGPELPEVFVLPTVTVALHDILVSTVTGVLVAHKSEKRGGKVRGGGRGWMERSWVEVGGGTHAPDWILSEPTSLLHHPMAWREG